MGNIVDLPLLGRVSSGVPLELNLYLYGGRYVGRLFVKSTGKPSEILTKLNEMAGYHPDEEIALFEVGLLCHPPFPAVT